MCNTVAMLVLRPLLATVAVLLTTLGLSQRLEPGTLAFSESAITSNNGWSIAFEMSGTFFPRTDTPDPEDAYLSGTAVQVSASANVGPIVNAPPGTTGYVVQKVDIFVGDREFTRIPRVWGSSVPQWVLFTSTHFQSGQNVTITARATFNGPLPFSAQVSRTFPVYNRSVTYRLRFDEAHPLALPLLDTAYSETKGFFTAGRYQVITEGELDKFTFLNGLTQATGWGTLTHGLPNCLDINFHPSGFETVSILPEVATAVNINTPKVPKTFHVVAIACQTLVGNPPPIETASQLNGTGGFIIGFDQSIAPFATRKANGENVSIGEPLNEIRELLQSGVTIEKAVEDVNDQFQFYGDNDEVEARIKFVGDPFGTLQHLRLPVALRQSIPAFADWAIQGGS